MNVNNIHKYSLAIYKYLFRATSWPGLLIYDTTRTNGPIPITSSEFALYITFIWLSQNTRLHLSQVMTLLRGQSDDTFTSSARNIYACIPLLYITANSGI